MRRFSVENQIFACTRLGSARLGSARLGSAIAVLCTLLALVAMLGCQRATPVQPEAPSPEPAPPPPGLQGSWIFTEDWYEHDDDLDDYVRIGTLVDVLTFTKSRYILYRSHYLMDGTFEYEWANSGTWEPTAQVITKIYYDNHDDDDDTPEVLRRLNKKYRWAEGRAELFLQHWDWGDPDAPYEVYKRVAVPADLAPVDGTWKGADDDDDGNGFTMTTTADGSFTIAVSVAESQAGRRGTWTATGKWTLDEAEYFLNLTELVREWTPAAGEESLPQDQPQTWNNGIGRIAYAPTDQPSQIVVSPIWQEREPDIGEEANFGDYWLLMTKQQ